MKYHKYLGPILIIFLLGCLISLGWIGSLDVRSGWVSYNRPVEFPEFSTESELALVFFGYTQCKSSCPVTLALLENVYRKYHTHKQKMIQALNVVTIDLSGDPKIDNYVQQFHPDFIGLSVEPKKLKKLLYSFNVTMRKSNNMQKSADNNQVVEQGVSIDHSGAVYLIIKVKGRWVLKRRYIDNPIKPQIIFNDLQSIGRSKSI